MVLVSCGLPAGTESLQYFPSKLSGFDMYVNRYLNWCADDVMCIHTHNKHRTPVKVLIHMHAAAYQPGEEVLEAFGAF